MDDVVDDLIRIARRCQRASLRFDNEPAKSVLQKLRVVLTGFGEAWSGSWLGYHSRVYTRGLWRKRPGEHFDTNWGLEQQFGNQSTGEWEEFSFETIENEAYRRTSVTSQQVSELGVIGEEVCQITAECLANLLPTLDALLSARDDPTIRQRRDELAKLPAHTSSSAFVQALAPVGEFRSSDMRAIQGGIEIPPHISFLARLMATQSTADQAKRVAEIVNYIVKYLQRTRKMKGKTAAKTDGPIFIGHGHSKEWKELKDFLHDRLTLDWEEFNRVPVAGLSNKERLLEMLDRCPFAFLVMTAEDEAKDGKLHARANVIHEAGLFQGRYGFERAIILLEEGCEEFSNMFGIGQIRFRKDHLSSVSEDLRRVLEREGLL